MGIVINYTPGTKVWVRLEGKKKLTVFKGPVPALWGGRLYCVVVGKKELALTADSIVDVYEPKKKQPKTTEQ